MLLGALLECCSWNAGGVLLESSWNAALAMVLEGCCCRALGRGFLEGVFLEGFCCGVYGFRVMEAS